MYGYIYKITDTRNNKYYIGKHKSPIIDDQYWGSGKIIKNIYKKYGIEVLNREILQECDSVTELNEAEKYWILKLDATNKDVGYNLASGGDGGDLTSNYNWYTNGINNFYLDSSMLNTLPDYLYRGRIIDNNNSEGYIWINNGIIELTIPENDLYLYPTFNKGMLDRGITWKNNIIKYASNRPESHNINISKSKKKFFEDNPDFRNDGNFKPNVPSHNKGKKSITNGVKNHYINIDEFLYWEQKGWYWGNTQKHNKKC